MSKEEEILAFLSSKVFDPILDSKVASRQVKAGVNYTIMRLQQLDANGMVRYFWSAIAGTDNSVRFSRFMKDEGFVRFEDIADEFAKRFNDEWLKS